MPLLSFTGLFYKTGHKVPEDFSCRVAGEGVYTEWRRKDAGNVVLGMVNMPSAPGASPYSREGLTICGDVVLHNRNELLAQFGDKVADKTNDLSIILEVYRARFTQAPAILEGAFAFAIWDEQRNALFCARDHIGLHPFYYFNDERIFLFANSVKTISGYAIASRLNEDKILDLLQSTRFTREQTIYKNVLRLPPAHWLLVRDNNFIQRKYWELNLDKETGCTSAAEAAESLRWLLEEAVKKRLPANANVGIELSGGLDSSTIAAIISGQLRGRHGSLFAFSNALPATEKQRYAGYADEWDKAERVAGFLGIKNHYSIDTTAGTPISLCENIIEKTGHPTNFHLSYYFTSIYRVAGIVPVNILYSGFGGDEGISVLAKARYAGNLAKNGKLFALARHHRQTGLSPLRSAWVTGRQFADYLSNGKQKRDRQLQKQRWTHLLLKDEVLKDEAIMQKYLDNEFFAEHTIRERMAYYITSGDTIERLETGYHTAGLYDIRYAYPLLDARLLEFFYRLPDQWKAMHKTDRGLFRNAISGILPVNVINQPKRAAMSTSIAPYARIECDEYFDKLRAWLLDLPDDHELYNFWSKKKVEGFKRPEGILEKRYYAQFLTAVMLAMLIEKRKNVKLYEL